MALAVVISTNGIPVSAAPSPYGLPVIVATNGYGMPVTPVASGGRPVFDTGGTLFGPATIPVNTGVPVITGTTIVGNTLSTSSGTWSGSAATYTYQWKRGGVAISGATSSSYLLVSADATTMITVTVTATNTAGNASATSAAVGPVTNVPIVMQADVGSFVFTGEDMTPITGYLMQAGVGAFTLTDPGTTNLVPPVTGTSATLAYQSFDASTSNAATVVYGPITYGTGADRIVAVIYWYGTVTISSVTIGGIATMTRVSGSATGSGNQIEVWESAAAPSGSSGSITVVFSGGTAYTSAVALYKLNTATPTRADAKTATTGTGTSLSLATPLSIPTNGVGLVAAYTNSGGALTAVNWAFDAGSTLGGVNFEWGKTTTTGSVTPGITWGSNDGGAITAVAWGP